MTPREAIERAEQYVVEIVGGRRVTRVDKFFCAILLNALFHSTIMKKNTVL